MPVKYFCGFEADKTILAADGIIMAATVVVSAAQRHRTISGFGGNNSLSLPNNGNTVRMPVYAAGVGEEIGIAVRFSSAGLMTFQFDSALVTNCYVSIEPDGFVRIYRTAGTLLATSADVLPALTWTYLKFVVTAREAASAGRVRVFVNGATTAFVDTGAGVDCRQGTADDFDSVNILVGANGYNIDDWVQASNGSLPDEPLFIQLMRPTAESGTPDGIPSTGTDNSATIDEDPVSLVDYNELQVAGHEDRFVMSNIVGSPGEVLGVRTLVHVTGEGSLTNARGLISSGGVDAYGTNQPTQVGGTYGVLGDVFLTDPNGGGALNATVVNALLAGYEAN